ncbi:MAG: RibD family protein, partial [Pyrinomonadaceae bacterium]
DEARKRVQDLRHENDAIVVGGNTASTDNPSLTDRSGKPRRRDLIRVVLDNRLRIPLDSMLVSSAIETPTIVFSNSTDEEKVETLFRHGVQVPRIDARDLNAVLDGLRKRGIQSILVEGGGEVAGAFVDAKLLDKVTFIIGPMIIGGHSAPTSIGGKGAVSLAEAFRLSDIEVKSLGEELEITGYPTK